MVATFLRSEEHTSELQSQSNLVCRLLLEKKKRFSSALRSANASLKPASLPGARRMSSTLAAPEAITRLRVDSMRSVARRSSTLFNAALNLSFFFNEAATTEIYTLSLHDALPI